jgi:hypothetical protein
MSGQGPASLPALALGDFGPGLDHVAEEFLHGKAFAILHRDDPARGILPQLVFLAEDPYTYVFVHGGEEVTRFQNLPANATYEIPAQVVAGLLRAHYGSRIVGMKVRICACYGNLLRPGDTATAVQAFARELQQTAFEGYHGLVHLRANPAEIRLGLSVRWDPQVGPVVVGPPGDWESVAP